MTDTEHATSGSNEKEDWSVADLNSYYHF